MNATLRVLTAMVAAVFFARLLSLRWLPSADLKGNPLGRQTAGLVDVIVIIGLPSVVLGWQSTAMTLLLAMFVTALLRPIFVAADLNQRFAVAIPVATATQLVTWRFAEHTWFWASVDSSPFVMMAAGVLVWLVSIMLVGIPARP